MTPGHNPFPILMYHKIDDPSPGALVPFHYVSPARFARQVSALVKFGFVTRSVESAIDESTRSKKVICLTFDDGYQNFADFAYPVLEKHDQVATVFLVSDLIGKTNQWDVEIGDVTEKLLDSDTIQMLAIKGIEFGSHTATHARLTKVIQNKVEQEVRQSKEAISELLGRDCTVFCYPYGSQNEAVRSIVRNSGFKLACSVEKGWNRTETDPYRLKRVNVRRDTSTPILFWKLWSQARLRPIDD